MARGVSHGASRVLNRVEDLTLDFAPYVVPEVAPLVPAARRVVGVRRRLIDALAARGEAALGVGARLQMRGKAPWKSHLVWYTDEDLGRMASKPEDRYYLDLAEKMIAESEWPGFNHVKVVCLDESDPDDPIVVGVTSTDGADELLFLTDEEYEGQGIAQGCIAAMLPEVELATEEEVRRGEWPPPYHAVAGSEAGAGFLASLPGKFGWKVFALIDWSGWDEEKEMWAEEAEGEERMQQQSPKLPRKGLISTYSTFDATLGRDVQVGVYVEASNGGWAVIKRAAEGVHGTPEVVGGAWSEANAKTKAQLFASEHIHQGRGGERMTTGPGAQERASACAPEAGPGVLAILGPDEILVYRTSRAREETEAICAALEQGKPGEALRTSVHVGTGLTGHNAEYERKLQTAVRKGQVPVFTSPYPSTAWFYRNMTGKVQGEMDNGWTPDPVTWAIVVPKSAVIWTNSRTYNTQGVFYSLTYPDAEIVIDGRQVRRILHVPAELIDAIGQRVKDLADQHSVRGAFANTYKDRDPAVAEAVRKQIVDLRMPQTNLGRPFVEVPITVAGAAGPISVKKGSKGILIDGQVVTFRGWRPLAEEHRHAYHGGQEGFFDTAGIVDKREGYVLDKGRGANLYPGLVARMLAEGEKATKGLKEEVATRHRDDLVRWQTWEVERLEAGVQASEARGEGDTYNVNEWRREAAAGRELLKGLNGGGARLRSRTTRTLPHQPRDPKHPGLQAQSLLFEKAVFPGKSDARRWALAHGFRAPAAEEQKNYWRLRQYEPSMNEKKSFRTIEFRPGVLAVVARPKI